MGKSTVIKLPLSADEKSILRKYHVRIVDFPDYTADELQSLLKISSQRAKELTALAEFQSIPSVGIKFAEDLVFLGYHSFDELAGKSGAELTDAYEQKKGYRTDPCVEDQFRLAAYYAESRDPSKNWWDFTEERKSYRLKHGYPLDRPEVSWFNMPEYNSK